MARIAFALVAAIAVGAQAGYLGVSRAQMAEKRFFTVAAVEPRGGVNVGQEPFPSAALPAGGGYVMRPPDQSGRWEVSAYLWSPGQIVVRRRRRRHRFRRHQRGVDPTEIKGLGKAFVLNRGNVVRVEFKADRAGIYPLVCATHQPSMRGEIVVLPKA